MHNLTDTTYTTGAIVATADEPWTWDASNQGWRSGGNLVMDAARAYAPAEPIPTAVEMRQARLALLRSGLLGNVDAALAAMPGAAGEEARIDWEYATTVRRGSQLVLSLGSSLGLDADQIDDLFRLAVTL